MRGKIIILNPNSSEETTGMMVRIANSCLDGRGTYAAEGVTATRSPKMIIDEPGLYGSVAEVLELGLALAAREDVGGIVVSAYGDPGLDELRRGTKLPVTGLCEASMAAAAEGGRRFGVATTTPDLASAIADKAGRLGYGGRFTGVRTPVEHPLELARNPDKTRAVLADLVRRCVEEDGAEAVIIGGGPLGQAAVSLSAEMALPIISPIPEAVRRLAALMAACR